MIKITPQVKHNEKEWLKFIAKEVFPGYSFQYNEGQKVGIAKDATFISLTDTEDIIRLEHKDDDASGKYGNLYIEFEQTWDFWKTKLDSGLTLAKVQSDVWAHTAYGPGVTYLYLWNPKKLHDAMTTASFPTKATADRKNGNKVGAFSRGWLIPFSEISKYYSTTYGPKAKWNSFEHLYEEMKYEVMQHEVCVN